MLRRLDKLPGFLVWILLQASAKAATPNVSVHWIEDLPMYSDPIYPISTLRASSDGHQLLWKCSSLEGKMFVAKKRIAFSQDGQSVLTVDEPTTAADDQSPAVTIAEPKTTLPTPGSAERDSGGNCADADAGGGFRFEDQDGNRVQENTPLDTIRQIGNVWVGTPGVVLFCVQDTIRNLVGSSVKEYEYDPLARRTLVVDCSGYMLYDHKSKERRRLELPRMGPMTDTYIWWHEYHILKGKDALIESRYPQARESDEEKIASIELPMPALRIVDFSGNKVCGIRLAPEGCWDYGAAHNIVSAAGMLAFIVRADGKAVVRVYRVD